MPSLLVLGAAFSSTQTPGQIFTTLYSLGNATDQAGGRPAAPLLLGPDGLLYGSTSEGVGAGILRGALFKITQDGSQLTVLKQFTNALDGGRPQGRLQLSGDTLFGITTLDGPLGGGTVFAARTNGDTFRVLAPLPANSFEDKHGSPVGGLTLAGSNLFGVTPIGGKSNCGAIFRLDASGANFQILKEFTGKDGAGPCGDLVTAGSVLYGTTVRGDSFFGSIFRMNDDGTGFEVLKRFERVAPDFTAADGANPSGGLVLAGDTLYGSTVSGGLDPTVGGLFKLNIDGSGYEIFQGLWTAESSYPSVGNIEGPPTLAGDLLYFVASSKTLDVSPSVWRVKTNGTELAQVCYARGGCVRGVSLAQGSLFGVATGTSFSVNSNALGHIFRSESTGTGSILHAFYGFSGDAGINSITRSGDYFYGTVATGGANSSGSIFRVRTDGTDFKLLLSFPSAETPGSRLLVSGTNIIGITRTFDPFNQVVYRISTDGSGFKLLHGIAALSGVTYAFGGPGLRPSFISAPVSFNGAIYGNLPDINVLFLGIYDGVYRMNPDGSDYRRVAPIAPIGELTVTRDAIYGVTLGTNYPEQVFFKISKADEYSVICRTTNLFSRPHGRFAVIGDSLFGVATFWGNGARVFKLATNGGDLSLLDPLTGSLAGDSTSTSLVATDNAIYGVTQAQAGVNGGAIFQLSTNGLNPAVVWEFPQTRGDAQIDPELIIENGVLYGSTYSGGDAGQGTIFRLDLAPKLNAMVSASRVTVSWPAFAQNYLLQRTERLTAPEWQTVNLPQGATSVTLTNSDGTFFFRLRAP